MEMSDQQPSHKRNCEGDNEPEQKRVKQDENREPINATKPEPKSLTNIYYDCLERIFDFLDLRSLLNVAETCKRLQIAAAAKFGDDHGAKYIMLFPLCSPPSIYYSDHELRVYNWKVCLPFVRCFGAKITKLYIKCYDGRMDHLDHYINQYCADTLKKMRFDGRIMTKNFLKPFKNVENLEVQHVQLDDNELSNIVYLFPKLRKLLTRDIWGSLAVDDQTTAAVNIPQLKHFTFTSNFSDIIDKSFLLANPHLQSISVNSTRYDEKSLDQLLDLISANSSISRLKLKGNIKAVNAVDVNRLASEHPLIKELIFLKHKLTAADTMMFIRQLNSLRFFEFRAKDQFQCDRIKAQLDKKWKFEQTFLPEENNFKIKLKLEE